MCISKKLKQVTSWDNYMPFKSRWEPFSAVHTKVKSHTMGIWYNDRIAQTLLLTIPTQKDHVCNTNMLRRLKLQRERTEWTVCFMVQCAEELSTKGNRQLTLKAIDIWPLNKDFLNKKKISLMVAILPPQFWWWKMTHLDGVLAIGIQCRAQRRCWIRANQQQFAFYFWIFSSLWK